MFFPVIFAVKFRYLETAFIHIKMDIAAIEIGRAGFPYFCIGVVFFNNLPYSGSDFFIDKFFKDEQQIQ